MSALPRLAPEDPFVAFLALAEALEANSAACAASARAVRAFAEMEARRPAEVEPSGLAMTLRATSRLLGVSVSFVRGAIKRGELQATQLGPRCFRVDPAHLEAYRKRHLIR